MAGSDWLYWLCQPPPPPGLLPGRYRMNNYEMAALKMRRVMQTGKNPLILISSIDGGTQ